MELSVSQYQFDNIIKPMQEGAILKCNEGFNYKTWLEMPDGSKKPLRKSSAIIVTSNGYDTGALIGYDESGITISPRATFKIK